MTKLSEHFSVEEFEYSDTAKVNKISNKMTEAQRKEAEHLCVYVLEPMRALFKEKYGKAFIKITSGFRGLALNKKVGGSSTSQHCCTPGRGSAADIWVYKYEGDKKVQVSPSEVYINIKTWVRSGKLTVDQCIDEKSKTASWTHVSVASYLKNCRKQFLLYRNGSYSVDK